MEPSEVVSTRPAMFFSFSTQGNMWESLCRTDLFGSFVDVSGPSKTFTAFVFNSWRYSGATRAKEHSTPARHQLTHLYTFWCRVESISTFSKNNPWNLYVFRMSFRAALALHGGGSHAIDTRLHSRNALLQFSDLRKQFLKKSPGAPFRPPVCFKISIM